MPNHVEPRQNIRSAQQLSEAAARRLLITDFKLAEPIMAKLDRYVAALLATTYHQLISRFDRSRIWQRHILDCAQLLRFFSQDSRTVLDLGSGAGLPGLVLACMRPDLQFCLIDVKAKRCQFLRNVSRETLLDNVMVVQSYVSTQQAQATARRSRRHTHLGSRHDNSPEFHLSGGTFVKLDFANIVPPTFDVLMARAFANIDACLTALAPFAHQNSQIILPRGQSWRRETAQLNQWKSWDWRIYPSITEPAARIFLGKIK